MVDDRRLKKVDMLGKTGLLATALESFVIYNGHYSFTKQHLTVAQSQAVLISFSCQFYAELTEIKVLLPVARLWAFSVVWVLRYFSPQTQKMYGNGLVEPWVMGKYCIVAYR